MTYLDRPQPIHPLAARLRADAAELRRSPSPDFTSRVQAALTSASPRRHGLRPRAFLPALAAAALLLTIGFVTWFDPGALDVTTGTPAGAGPRVVEFAHPRAWGTLLCDSYTEGVEGRLESELDGVMGDVGRVARALVARLPSGLRNRVGFEAR